ncbi:MAG TPA: hypothetical protein VHD87_13020 [Acidimicrobiales bacterium]|nr:hypothetical protein [Acidimicrobiales bacterium]
MADRARQRLTPADLFVAAVLDAYGRARDLRVALDGAGHNVIGELSYLGVMRVKSDVNMLRRVAGDDPHAVRIVRSALTAAHDVLELALADLDENLR